MTMTILLPVCLAVSLLSFNARSQSAQDERQYTEGPVTLVQEIGVEYGRLPPLPIKSIAYALKN